MTDATAPNPGHRDLRAEKMHAERRTATATLAGVRDQLNTAAAEWETVAGLLTAAVPELAKDRATRGHAIRARAAARTFRENAQQLRDIAGPDPVCMYGHGAGEREDAAA